MSTIQIEMNLLSDTRYSEVCLFIKKGDRLISESINGNKLVLSDRLYRLYCKKYIKIPSSLLLKVVYYDNINKTEIIVNESQDQMIIPKTFWTNKLTQLQKTFKDLTDLVSYTTVNGNTFIGFDTKTMYSIIIQHKKELTIIDLPKLRFPDFIKYTTRIYYKEIGRV